MFNQQNSKIVAFLANFKNSIWLLGIAFWFFGITDRSLVMQRSLAKVGYS